MARLGELLVAAKVLTAEQVEQALRAQVMWGGRLGTNLIELGFLDLDALSKALGRQHGQPAALARHFDKADRELQRILSPDVAERYSCVPLMRVGPKGDSAKPPLIAFASVAPLDAKGLAIVADELGVTKDQLLPSIAAELRIRYHLERAYEIPRGTRFLRSKGKTIPPFPQFSIDIDTTQQSDEHSLHDISIDEEPAPVAVAPAPAPIAHAEPEPESEPEIVEEVVDFSSIAVLEDDELSVPQSAIADEPSGRERRKYVRTIGDVAPEPPVNERHALGRIAIKKVAVTPPTGSASTSQTMPAVTMPVMGKTSPGLGGPAAAPVTSRATPSAGYPAMGKTSPGLGPSPLAATPPPTEPAAIQTLGEATRAIRRSTDRDKVGDLVIATLEKFVPTCQAAVLLVVRGELAIGWKGFNRSGAAVPEIGVPLQEPGLVPRAVQRAQSLRSPATDLTPIDQLLLVSLMQQAGDLVVVPVTIGGQVMCLITMVTARDEQIASTESIAAAAGAAFARLMRDASR